MPAINLRTISLRRISRTRSSGWFFGATGTWNVWDGGATYGRVTQAKAQLMQSKNNYDNGIRQVVLDVQQAISNLQQAQETIDSQTASVVQATEALRLSKERLDAGAGTQLDVLNAQVQLAPSPDQRSPGAL